MDAGFDFFQPSSPQGDPNARSRVLIAEDHPDLARTMTWLLRHHGFDAQAVTCGDHVFPTALTFRADFLLLDIGLPGLDGYQVAELIRRDPALSNVIIIAVSAYGPDTHPARSRRAGFNHHLTKPVNIDELLPLLVRPRD
jgi:DNA-binding response OmpR family regulator